MRSSVWRVRWILLILLTPFVPVLAQSPDNAALELLHQQERERVLREQQETSADVRLRSSRLPSPEQLPLNETPCFPISRIQLDGEDAHRFTRALKAADVKHDPATGSCLGTGGINVVISRIQNAIIARGFITSRILAAPQDLNTGLLTLTVVPGRVRTVRFTDNSSGKTTVRNAVPVNPGDLLNLRDIEQALENFRRVPTVEADIQIVPSDGEDARPGESDLVIGWRQRSAPLRLTVTLDDSGSKATGKFQTGVTLAPDNLFMWNDLFYVNVGGGVFNASGKGSSSYSVHYSVPYGYWTFSSTLSGYRYHQTVTGHSQNYIYSGNSNNAGLRLSRLVYRDGTGKTILYGRGWMRKSSSFIDDTEIGVQRRRTAGWELGLTHREYLKENTLDTSLSWRRGTGAFNAMSAPEEEFGEGTSRMKVITADVQLMIPLNFASQRARYTGSWRGQWDRTPLVPQDRFSIGGRYSVRGFSGELALTGERGWIWRNELGVLSRTDQELYFAVDYGQVSGPSTVWLAGRSLAGSVIGLRGSARGFCWDFFAGIPLSKPRGWQTDSFTSGFTLSWWC